MTEKDECRPEMLCNPSRDPELQQKMLQAADLCFRYNDTPPSDTQERDRILTELLGAEKKPVGAVQYLGLLCVMAGIAVLRFT